MSVDAGMGVDPGSGRDRPEDSLLLGTIDEVVSCCRWGKGLESASR